MKFARSHRRLERSRSGPSHGTAGARRRGARAFTLVEILAALLMMAIIVPVAMEGMSIASRAGVLGHRKAAAMRVAERVLNEIVVHGETNHNVSSGTTAEGDVNYAWTMRVETWPEDTMQHITVTVTFTVRGDEFNVSASTLLSPTTEQLQEAAAAASTEP